MVLLPVALGNRTRVRAVAAATALTVFCDGCLTLEKVTPGKPISIQRAGTATHYYLQGDRVLDYASLGEELEREEASRDSARSARRWLFAAGLVEGAGLGMATGGIVTMSMDKRFGWGWLLGGAATVWAGTYVVGAGLSRMDEAVQRYNAALQPTQAPPTSSFVTVSPWLAALPARDARMCPAGGLRVEF